MCVLIQDQDDFKCWILFQCFKYQALILKETNYSGGERPVVARGYRWGEDGISEQQLQGSFLE